MRGTKGESACWLASLNRLALIVSLAAVTCSFFALPSRVWAEPRSCEFVLAPSQSKLKLRVLDLNVGGKLIPRDINGPEDAADAASMHRLLSHYRPQIGVFQEIPGEDALTRFLSSKDNGRRWGNEYRKVMKSGLQSENAEIGFLISKDLDEHFRFEVDSFAELKLGDLGPAPKGLDLDLQRPLFPRNLPALIAYAHGSNTPSFIFIGVHAKSKIVKHGHDPRIPIEIQNRQFKAIAEISNRYLRRFGPDLPIFLVGDLNVELRRLNQVPEALKSIPSAFDIADEGAKMGEQEWSFVLLDKAAVRPPQFNRLDDIRVLNVPKIDSIGIYALRDERGRPYPFPKSQSDKWTPGRTDHDPVVGEFQVLIRR